MEVTISSLQVWRYEFAFDDSSIKKGSDNSRQQQKMDLTFQSDTQRFSETRPGEHWGGFSFQFAGFSARPGNFFSATDTLNFHACEGTSQHMWETAD